MKKIKKGLIVCEKYSVMNCHYWYLNGHGKGLPENKWCKACKKKENK